LNKADSRGEIKQFTLYPEYPALQQSQSRDEVAAGPHYGADWPSARRATSKLLPAAVDRFVDFRHRIMPTTGFARDGLIAAHIAPNLIKFDACILDQRRGRKMDT
jgi:hypothetical protein